MMLKKDLFNLIFFWNLVQVPAHFVKMIYHIFVCVHHLPTRPFFSKRYINILCFLHHGGQNHSRKYWRGVWFSFKGLCHVFLTGLAGTNLGRSLKGTLAYLGEIHVWLTLICTRKVLQNSDPPPHKKKIYYQTWWNVDVTITLPCFLGGGHPTHVHFSVHFILVTGSSTWKP